MKLLTDSLKEHESEIRRRLYLGYVRWEDLIARLETRERSTSGVLGDEQVWTFLVGCGYVISGTDGLARVTNILTGTDLRQPDDAKIWLEVLPLPPRNHEGATHVDLAVGTIARRGNSRSGISLRRGSPTWICFCEMKWDSDISMKVRYDPDRNQLARVIENALCFQGEVTYSDEVHVALVTPETFKRPEGDYREYQGAFRRYDSERATLRRDLAACRLGKKDGRDWKYPADIDGRADSLNLRWATYEDLFAGMPASAISGGLQRFWERSGRIRR